jgi:hypothetical protein
MDTLKDFMRTLLIALCLVGSAWAQNPFSPKWPLVDSDVGVATNAIVTPTLTAGINSTDTSMTLSSCAGWLAPASTMLDNEIISFSGISSCTLTGLGRHAEGTTAASHLLGVSARRPPFADTWNQAMANLKALTITAIAQKFFVTAPPGSIAGNLPGDTVSDSTNHNDYWCNAPSGTAAPACTSVTTGGWTLLNGGGGGSGTVTSSGSPTIHQIPIFTTGVDIKGLTLGAHQVAVGAAGADPSAKTVPDCQDSAGNHINYTQSTDTLTCGTSSGGGGGVSAANQLTDLTAVRTTALIATFTVPANGIRIDFDSDIQTFAAGTLTVTGSGTWCSSAGLLWLSARSDGVWQLDANSAVDLSQVSVASMTKASNAATRNPIGLKAGWKVACGNSTTNQLDTSPFTDLRAFQTEQSITGGTFVIPTKHSGYTSLDIDGARLQGTGADIPTVVPHTASAGSPWCDDASGAATIVGCTGGGGGGALSAVTAAVGSNTIANGDYPQVWNSHLTTSSQIAMLFGETTAATAAGAPYLLQMKTLAGSTAIPMNITNSLTGSQALSTLFITPTWNTTGLPTAFKMNVIDTASNGSSLLMDLQVGSVSQFSVKKDGTLTAGYATFGGSVQAPSLTAVNYVFCPGSVCLISAAGGFSLAQGTPANSSASCTANQLLADSNYIYFCVATNTWKRSAITTW